jgi:hypothetical protein
MVAAAQTKDLVLTWRRYTTENSCSPKLAQPTSAHPMTFHFLIWTHLHMATT